MNITRYGRRGGKTWQLVQKLKDNPQAIMLTFCQQEADRVVKDYDPDGKFDFVSRVKVADPTKVVGIDRSIPVYIDNLDLVLLRLFDLNIDSCTYTG